MRRKRELDISDRQSYFTTKGLNSKRIDPDRPQGSHCILLGRQHGRSDVTCNTLFYKLFCRGWQEQFVILKRLNLSLFMSTSLKNPGKKFSSLRNSSLKQHNDQLLRSWHKLQRDDNMFCKNIIDGITKWRIPHRDPRLSGPLDMDENSSLTLCLCVYRFLFR